MDAETLEQFRTFAVPNPGKGTKVMPHLTTDEQALHNHLCTAALRLEQERVTQDWLVGRLSLLSS